MTCREIPAVPGQLAIAPSYSAVPDYAWNSGANSVAEVEGDLRLTFNMGAAVGAVIGLYPANERGSWSAAERERIRHGLYFHRAANGAPRFAVLEAGKQITASAPYVPGDAFTIRRVGGQVEYLHGARRVLLSLQPSGAAQIVGGCLFASEDALPSTTPGAGGGEEPGGVDGPLLRTMNGEADISGLLELVDQGFNPEADARVIVVENVHEFWLYYDVDLAQSWHTDNWEPALGPVPALLRQGGNEWPITYLREPS